MGNDSELNIVVKAKNDASKVLKDVNNDVDGMSGNLKKAFDNAVGPSQALMAGVIGAGAAVAGFGVASVAAYGEAQLASAQLDAVLQSTGNAARVTKDELMAQATALQSVTMFSDEAVQATQAMLLTFTNLKDNVMKDATAVALDMAQALGMDGKQAAMQLGKALNDPAEGLSKLTRVGVTFSAEQEKQVRAMQEAGDVAGAQKVILAELTKEFGGSAKAAGQTFPGQLEILKNTFGDLMEGVGEFITGALHPATEALAKWIKKVQDAGGFMKFLSGIWERNKDNIKILAAGILGGLVPAIVTLAGSIASVVLALAPFVLAGAAVMFLWEKARVVLAAAAGVLAFMAGGALVTLVTGLWSLASVMAVVVPIWLAANAPMLLWAAAAAAVAAGAYLIITHWETVKTFFVNLWQTIQDIFGTIGSWFKDRFNEATDAIVGAYQGVVDTVKGVFDAIAGFVEDHKQAIINWSIVITTILLPKIVQIGVRMAISAAQSVAAFISMAASAVAQAAIATASWVASAASTAFAWVTTTLPKIIASFVSMSASAVAQAAVATGAWLLSAGQTLIGWGISFAGYLVGVATMVASTAIAALQLAASWLLALGPIGLIIAAVVGVTALIIANWDTVKGWLASFWAWLKDSASAAWQAVKNVFSGIGSFFSGVYNNLINIFKGIGSAVGNAISGGFKAIINTVIGLAEAEVNGFIRLLNGAINIINKIPKVNIPKIGEFNLPRLETGAVNFAGGTALVGERGPELVTLPKGANVYTAPQTKDMLGGGGGVTTNVYGPVNLNSADAVREFMGQLDRNSQLAQLGVPT